MDAATLQVARQAAVSSPLSAAAAAHATIVAMIKALDADHSRMVRRLTAGEATAWGASVEIMCVAVQTVSRSSESIQTAKVLRHEFLTITEFLTSLNVSTEFDRKELTAKFADQLKRQQQIADQLLQLAIAA